MIRPQNSITLENDLFRVADQWDLKPPWRYGETRMWQQVDVCIRDGVLNHPDRHYLKVILLSAALRHRISA